MNPAMIQGANLMIPGRSTTTDHRSDYASVAGSKCSHRSEGRGMRFAILRTINPGFRFERLNRMSILGDQ